MRFHSQTTAFENGLVILPEGENFVACYVDEIAGFPGTKHDDQVDSTSQALEWMRTPLSGMGCFQYYKNMNKQARNDAMFPVQMKMPDGLPGRFGMGNRVMDPGPERIIMVSEAEAAILIKQGFVRLN